MTTIAWDGKTLAADRQFNHSGTPIAKTKIHTCISNVDMRIKIFGCAGDSFDAMALKEYWKGERNLAPAITDLEIMVIDNTKKIYIVTEKMIFHEVEDKPFYAIGSGADYAIGAMAMGATAKEAVEIASKFDIHTGMGIDELHFE